VEVGVFFSCAFLFNGTQRKVRSQPGCGSSSGPENQAGWRDSRPERGQPRLQEGTLGGSQDITVWREEHELSPPPAGLTQCPAVPEAETPRRGKGLGGLDAGVILSPGNCQQSSNRFFISLLSASPLAPLLLLWLFSPDATDSSPSWTPFPEAGASHPVG